MGERKFGRLKIIKEVGKNKYNQKLLKCLCDCGEETTVLDYNLRGGHTKSCGCLRKEKVAERYKGKQIPKEMRQKMSKAKKGKPLSKKHRENLSKALKGIPKSEIHKKRISESNKGKHVHSEEFKRKMSELHKGEKNINWKGGISSERAQEMGTSKYREWRTSVFKKDNYKCRICGDGAGRLNAHHKYPWALYPDLRYDISNGITLCKEHHDMFHRNENIEIKELIICGLS